MAKYKLMMISGVALGIGREIQEGYSEMVLEGILPSDEELVKMSGKKQIQWTKTHNDFMQKVCDAMNKENV